MLPWPNPMALPDDITYQPHGVKVVCFYDLGSGHTRLDGTNCWVMLHATSNWHNIYHRWKLCQLCNKRARSKWANKSRITGETYRVGAGGMRRPSCPDGPSLWRLTDRPGPLIYQNYAPQVSRDWPGGRPARHDSPESRGGCGVRSAGSFRSHNRVTVG